jgi:hypothetical protein
MSFSATQRGWSKALEPDPATSVAKMGDMFQLGPHRLICGDATDPAVLARLLEGDAPARLVLTDEPHNVRIAGNVTGGSHREFAMASGEMTDAELLAFNGAWMATMLPYLCDGAILSTFYRLARLIDGFGRRGKVGPQAAQLDRLGEVERRYGQPLSLAA